MKKYYFSFLCILSLHCLAQKQNGEPWKDIDGNIINAHGGGILFHDNVYYWFGEIKKGITWLVPDQQWEDYRVPAGGIGCYSSTDLKKWKYEGVALSAVTGTASHDLDTSKVIERPKVIFNSRTKQFVMWMHVDANDYSYSQAGVAVSNNAAGPYKYIGSVKPNGQMSRDMTLYKDIDDRAYLIYASESNKTMHVCLLNDDYLSPSTTYTRITSAVNREAPAVFRYNKKYYLVTSGCTGWSPNEATYAIADSLLGEWSQMGNPCIGAGADTTFGSQGTFILPVPGEKDMFLFMADKWNKTNLPGSGYIWLPLKMKDSKPQIEWIKKINTLNKETVNILPLGNSITNGTGIYNSYRRHLWQLLDSAHYNVDFIGSWDRHHNGGAVPDPDFDMDHEGHSGWTAHNILYPPAWDSARGNIDSWLKEYRPDIVLIELGINDIFQCSGVPVIINDLSLIIDKLRAKNSKVKVLLANVMPLGNEWAPKKLCGTDTSYAQSIEIFNSAVIKFTVNKTSRKSPVIIVDQFTGIEPAKDMYDGIHPNTKGEKKMADRWYDAMLSFLKKRKQQL